MKTTKYIRPTAILIMVAFFLAPLAGQADDTCTFTTSDVTPNIVLLLDNGAASENIVWHSRFDDNIDYTPLAGAPVDATESTVGTLVLSGITGAFADGEGLTIGPKTFARVDGALYNNNGVAGPTTGMLDFRDRTGTVKVGDLVTGALSASTGVVQAIISKGNGFFNNPQLGYVMDAGVLRPVQANLDPDLNRGLVTSSGKITFNNRTISLPFTPDNKAFNGVIDNADRFRYSTNYLNWLFYHSTGTVKLNNITLGPNGAGFIAGEALTGSAGQTLHADTAESGGVLRYYMPAAQVSAMGHLKVGDWITGVYSGAKAQVTANAVNTDAYINDGTDLPDRTRFYYAKKAIMEVIKTTVDLNNSKLLANFGLFNFSSATTGANNTLPIKGSLITSFDPVDPALNTLDANWVNALNNMGTFNYSPLAKGLGSVGYYLSSSAISAYIDVYYCQKTFVLVITSGDSSYDDPVATKYNPSQSVPNDLTINHDGDAVEGEIEINGVSTPIPQNILGATYLDDVAAYLYDNKIVYGGFQNVMTYTLGFMSNPTSDKYLINTSNNGNGHKNLYDTANPEYGKYHFRAEDADDIADKLKDAISSILSLTSTFTAPVVPVTRTTSGSDIYLAFFKPIEDNFWEGDVAKYGIDLDTLEIIDANGNPATYPNGALKETAEPFWSTKDWAKDPISAPSVAKPNGIHNSSRNIYTYLGYATNLNSSTNWFKTTNTYLKERHLAYPLSGKNNLINYFRGADVYDQDADGNITENREVITGDVLHSEPAVFQYRYADGSSKTMVFFGSNDGMLHAVYDVDVTSGGTETSHGTEAWAFIPPDLLNRLKEMLEGTTHPYYVDSSPKVYFKNIYDDDTVDIADGDMVILICGERKGGNSYFALDITNPFAPQFLWRMGHETSGTLIFNNLYQYNNDTTGTLPQGVFQDNDTFAEYYGTTPYATATISGTLKGELAYDNLQGGFSFNVGDLVTGASSGATGRITGVDAATGIIQFENVTHRTSASYCPLVPPVPPAVSTCTYSFGSFIDNEQLMVAGNYIADANGNLYDMHLDYFNATESFASNQWARNQYPYTTPPLAYGYISTTVPLNPDTFVPELGESWSEPVFGSVLTTSPGDAGYATDEGTPVFFVGGGYTDDNLKGLAVLAVNVETGKIVKMWSSSPDSAVNTQTPGMNYSFASAVKPVDENNNGFVDKLYVGDLGGQMWRIGKFTDASNVQLPFPETEENINDWTASLLFTAGCGEGAGNCLDGADDNGNGFIDEPMKFFYPPSVTLERGYDLVLMVTGDRENACDPNTIDGVAAVKDDHTATTYIPADLVDVSDEATATVPYLDGGDNGWYLTLEPGEKVQATGIVFFKTFYFTTFRPSIPSDPNYDPCLPGGVGRLYAVNYKTGGSVLSFGGGSLTRSTFIGGGIPSRPVMIIPPKGMPKLYISVGSTDESDAASGGNFGAGVVAVNPLAPPINFHYLWWRELVD